MSVLSIRRNIGEVIVISGPTYRVEVSLTWVDGGSKQAVITVLCPDSAKITRKEIEGRPAGDGRTA